MKKRISGRLPWQQFTIAVIVILTLIGGTWTGVVNHASAAGSAEETESIQSECSANLDVIFLVDQSSSMGGLPNSAQLGNDPTLQRKWAVQGMIDMLVDLTLGQCPGSYHRIGVVSFGDDSEVDLPISIIAPATSDEGNRLRDDLKTKITAKNLGTTNMSAAFDSAKHLFDNSGITPAGTENRKRVIILITDGYPSRGSSGSLDYLTTSSLLTNQVNFEFPFSNDLLNLENCLSELRENYARVQAEIPAGEINKCMNDNPVTPDSYKNSTYIWTILLKSDQAYPVGVLDNFEDMSQAHAGEMIQLSQNRSDIPSTLRQILSILANVHPNLLNCGSFAVNPYLNRIIINAYEIDDQKSITLSYIDAAGSEHTIQSTDRDTQGLRLPPAPAAGFSVDEYYSYGPNERYVFKYPYPGIWKLTAENCDGLDVYYDPINIDSSLSTTNLPAQMPQFDRQPYYPSDNPFYLEYTIKDSNNQQIAQADADIFNITVNATITPPTGSGANPQNVILKWDSGDQLFRAANPLIVPVPGVYTISIVGKSHRHIGEPAIDSNASVGEVFSTEYDVFAQQNLQLTVYPVTPFEIEPGTPVSGAVSRSVHASIFKGWPLKVNPIPVRIRITDRQHNILTNTSEIFVDPNNAITAMVSAGSQSAVPVILTPDPNSPGEFVGQITDFGVVGSQTLVVELQESAIRQPYMPDAHRIEVPFTRAEFLWTLPAFYYSLFILILMVFLFGIVYNIAIRTNKVSGTLYFKDGNTTIAEFGLYNGTNFRTLKRKELSLYPQLMLKSAKIQNAGKRKKAGKPEHVDAVTGSLFTDVNGPLGIRVSLVTFNGRRFTMDIEPDLPTTYGDETFAQMLYEPIK